MNEALRIGEVDLASRRAELDKSLHESLVAKQEAIAMYEARINDAISREDTIAASSITIEAVKYLDSDWEFHQRPLLIVGTWHRGQVVSTGEAGEFQLGLIKEEVATQRPSVGFMGLNVEGKARIGLGFIASHGSISAPLTGMDIVNYATVLPEEAAISMGPSFVGDDHPALMRQIANGAFMQDKLIKLLKRHTPDHAKPRDNREAISQIVAKANSLIGVDDVPYIIDVETMTVFSHDVDGSDGQLTCLETVDTPISVRGRLLGATALELIENIPTDSEATLTDEDTRDVGLVFAIEPAEHNLPGEAQHGVLYVPFDAKSLHFSLSQSE